MAGGDPGGQNHCDVILMDVQMQANGGAGRHPRKEQPGNRVPIIAMTAHAMEGDRQRCLAAGMDGYLPKPVNAQEMIRLVEGLARGAAPTVQPAAATPEPAGTSPAKPTAVFNPDKALAQCWNSQEMLREMIQYFFRESDNLLGRMRAALEQGDLVKVGELGHRLREPSSTSGHNPLGSCAEWNASIMPTAATGRSRASRQHSAGMHHIEGRNRRASAGNRIKAG